MNGSQIIGLKDFGFWDDTHDFLDAIVSKKNLSEKEMRQGAISKASHDKHLLCTCMRITKGEVANAIKTGCCSFEDIRVQTKACTVCGACRPMILEMLGKEVWVPYKMIASKIHGKTIRSFRLYPLEKSLPTFQPGQHIILRATIGNFEIQRCYTLTSHPTDPYFEVTVKKEERGLFSPWLYKNAEMNPLIHISGPYGDFVLAETASTVLCFAGGIGVTPFVAFAKRAKQKLVIDYSARTKDDFAFREELEKSNAEVNFRATDEKGMLNREEILHLVKRHLPSDIYICGPSGFESFIIDTLENSGYTKDRIHVEQFVQAGAPKDTPQMVTF